MPAQYVATIGRFDALPEGPDFQPRQDFQLTEGVYPIGTAANEEEQSICLPDPLKPEARQRLQPGLYGGKIVLPQYAGDISRGLSRTHGELYREQLGGIGDQYTYRHIRAGVQTIAWNPLRSEGNEKITVPGPMDLCWTLLRGEEPPMHRYLLFGGQPQRDAVDDRTVEEIFGPVGGSGFYLRVSYYPEELTPAPTE